MKDTEESIIIKSIAFPFAVIIFCALMFKIVCQDSFKFLRKSTFNGVRFLRRKIRASIKRRAA